MALKQVIDVGGQGEAPRSRDIAGSGSAYAKNTNFDPTNTDFESTNVQALGEEIDGALSTKASKSNLSDYILTGTKPSTALSEGTFFVDKDGALRVATADIATTDDVGSGNSEVKSVGEILTELNSNFVLLWTNPDPFVEFQAQTIPLDLSNYKGILVYSKSANSNAESNLGSSLIVLKGLSCKILTGNTYAYRERLCTVNDNGVVFGDGYQGSYNNDISVLAVVNVSSIPVKIYGIR